MKLYIRIFLSLLITTSFFSCQKEVSPTLSLSTSQVDIANVDGSYEITVTSNSNWTATVTESWFTVTPSSGKGNGTIKVTASNNFSDVARTGSLKVVCKDLFKIVSFSQSFSQLSIDADTLLFSKDGGAKILNISSNTKWQLEIPSSANWINASVLSGDGNLSVSFSTLANTVGAARSANVLLKYGSSLKTITISQSRAKNSAPTAPIISYPADNSTNVLTIPGFSWTASTDIDNDPVTYTLYYSKDNVNWTEASTTKNLFYPTSHLSENTTYKWKVKATDSYGDYTISSLFSFTTGLKSGYADGEYRIHQNATLGVNGDAAEILIMGDGYTGESFQEGGTFEQNVKEGIDNFFSVEPYKSYKNYFRVYKMAAHSADNGATQKDKNSYKSTAFSSSFNGGSAISCNSDEVFRYARKISGMTDARLKKLLIIIIVNQNRYAGTCFMWGDGRAIALCPLSRSVSTGTSFKNVINHEAGGHGFGKLADEYINNEGKTIPDDAKADAQAYFAIDFYPNVDFTSDPTAARWKHFIDRQGYGRVGLYQGALYYSLGVWKPETSSCMVYNEPYYNAPSREAMVKRIMSYSGNTFNFNDFVNKDIEKSPSNASQVFTKSVNPFTFVPLAPPVFKH